MHLPSRAIPSSLGVLAAAALVTLPTSARADAPDRVAFSPGLALGVSFGQKVAFALTFDFRVTGIVAGHASPQFCPADNRSGLGPYAQITWLNFSAWRFGAGGHGGGEVLKQAIGVDGELGWTYHTHYDDAHPGQHGLQVGLAGLLTLLPLGPSLEVPVRGVLPVGSRPFVPEMTAGIVGLRYPPVFGFPAGPGRCVTGRPLRAGRDVLLPAVVARGRRPRGHAGLDGGTRAAIAGAWLEDARAECASVPAFLALARDLAAAGAPGALMGRAAGAALDEVRHTLLCAGLAADHSGVDAAPLLMAPPPSADADRRAALLRMALEAWIDGCVGEGAAASRAALALAGCADPAARAALTTIARDEARHAEVGWSVLDFCLSAGGAEVADAVAEAIGAPEPEPPRCDAESSADPRALRAHGRLAQAEGDRAWIETVSQARARAARLLSAVRGPPVPQGGRVARVRRHRILPDGQPSPPRGSGS